MKYIITAIAFFLLGLLIGMYEAKSLFSHFSQRPILAILIGVLVAGGFGYLLFKTTNRITKTDKFSQIAKIDAMKEKGLLTKEEFEVEKKKILEKPENN